MRVNEEKKVTKLKEMTEKKNQKKSRQGGEKTKGKYEGNHHQTLTTK